MIDVVRDMERDASRSLSVSRGDLRVLGRLSCTLGFVQQGHERRVGETVPVRRIVADTTPDLVVLEDERTTGPSVITARHLVDLPPHSFGAHDPRWREALPRCGWCTVEFIGRPGMHTSA